MGEFKQNNIQNTFFVEFSIEYIVYRPNIDIEYTLIENGIVLQEERTRITNHHFHSSEILILMKPITLNPYKRYRFEYKLFKTLPNKGLGLAEQHKINNPEIRYSEHKTVRFIFYRADSHLDQFGFGLIRL